MEIDGVRVFGVKDFSGNVQMVHAIETTDAIYIFDKDRLVQIQSDLEFFMFSYNTTINQYMVTFISENGSYEIPSSYATPEVKFPQPVFELPDNTSTMPDPFTGIIVDLEDKVTGEPISGAIVLVNYYSEQHTNNISTVLKNIGGSTGRYYSTLPTNDTTVEKYLDTNKLRRTISQQSDALIELIRAYPMSDICSKVLESAKPFCSRIVEEMSVTIPNVLNKASAYSSEISVQSKSPSQPIPNQYEVLIFVPGEPAFATPLNYKLNYDTIDPNKMNLVSIRAGGSRSKCNTQTVAGNDTPDDRVIDIGKSNTAVKFRYETYTVKDQIDVYYKNKRVFTSLCVGTDGERATSIQLDDNESSIRVNVIPNCAGGSGTAWYYTVECPNNELICNNGICYCGLEKRQSRQVKPPTFNGCGTDDSLVTDWYVGPVGRKWKFTPYCDEHDRCYGTCNKIKSDCDDRFEFQLRGSCGENWNSTRWVYLECMGHANDFSRGVKWFAGSAFDDAQREFCICDENLLKAVSNANNHTV